MEKNDTVTNPNSQNSIKCSQCGNEKNEFYLISPNSTEMISEIGLMNPDKENHLTGQQKYLAHIFEAQKRFGE